MKYKLMSNDPSYIKLIKGVFKKDGLDVLIENNTYLIFNSKYYKTVLKICQEKYLIFTPNIMTGNITSSGANVTVYGTIGELINVSEIGFVYNNSDNPTINDQRIVVSPNALSFNTIFRSIFLFEDIYVRTYAIYSGGIVYGNVVQKFVICLAKGTLITLSDRTTKPIEDITYLDDLLVWNFDEGVFSSAKPLWIKKTEHTSTSSLLEFSNGSHLETINNHRIFNTDVGSFTQSMTDETPIGTTTFTDTNTSTTLVSNKILKETIEYYNIITTYHINMFANGILTSCKYSNIYPINNMKYNIDQQKRNNVVISNLPDKYKTGLRLSEQSIPIDDSITYINNLIKHEKQT